MKAARAVPYEKPEPPRKEECWRTMLWCTFCWIIAYNQWLCRYSLMAIVDQPIKPLTTPIPKRLLVRSTSEVNFVPNLVGNWFWWDKWGFLINMDGSIAMHVKKHYVVILQMVWIIKIWYLSPCCLSIHKGSFQHWLEIGNRIYYYSSQTISCLCFQISITSGL